MPNCHEKPMNSEVKMDLVKEPEEPVIKTGVACSVPDHLGAMGSNVCAPFLPAADTVSPARSFRD